MCCAKLIYWPPSGFQNRCASLHQSVKETLLKHDLRLENVRGQGNDGTATMSGQYSGLQSIS